MASDRHLARRLGALGLALATGLAAAAGRPAANASPATAPLHNGTLADARACDALDDSLEDRKARLQGEIDANQRGLAELQALNDDLAAMAAVMDHGSQPAVDLYNQKVDELNRRSAELNRRADVHNAEMAAFNQDVFARNAKCATLMLSHADAEVARRERAARQKAKEKARAAAAAASAAQAASAAAAAAAAASQPAASAGQQPG